MTGALSWPRSPGADNEDAVALGDGVAVVVDGAGIPASLMRGCRHAVSWYSNSVATALRDELVAGKGTAVDALEVALARVAASHPECDLTAVSPSATVAAWRQDGDEVEYLVLCDASIVLVDRDGTATQVTDDRLAQLVSAAEVGVSGRDELMAARMDVLETWRNRDGGFWCCHHDPSAARHALTGRVPLGSLRGIMATSDGATRGHDLLGSLPLQDFSDLVMAGRADDAAAAIRRAEDEQAGQLATQAHKPHDDLTILWERFDG